MSAPNILNIDTSCLHCQRRNTLVLGGIRPSRKVTCSSCGSPLGEVGDLSHLSAEKEFHRLDAIRDRRVDPVAGGCPHPNILLLASAAYSASHLEG